MGTIGGEAHQRGLCSLVVRRRTFRTAGFRFAASCGAQSIDMQANKNEPGRLRAAWARANNVDVCLGRTGESSCWNPLRESD